MEKHTHDRPSGVLGYAPMQTSAMLYGWSPGACSWGPAGPGRFDPGNLLSPEIDIANFELIRGPFGFIGSGWQGCSLSYERPPLLDRDFGTPLGLCAETAPGSGVFSREFSTVTVSVDSATWRRRSSGSEAVRGSHGVVTDASK